MTEIAIALPEQIAKRLQQHWGNLPQWLLKLMLVEAYWAKLVTRDEVRQILQPASAEEVNAFLGRRESGLLQGSFESILSCLDGNPLVAGMGRSPEVMELEIAAEREAWE